MLLLYLCVLSCVFFTFTDSLVGTDGKVYYGIATLKGFFVFNFEGTTMAGPSYSRTWKDTTSALLITFMPSSPCSSSLLSPSATSPFRSVSSHMLATTPRSYSSTYPWALVSWQAWSSSSSPLLARVWAPPILLPPGPFS
ncbi:hypothetical protein FCM35_KLT21189 [Carex littledalei]|uniref:Uncharacterized protein n=1 Tax=Carex littledalei TaxID=544730 RepID=A0A833QWZ2_9POAL|nr:hypothetical protein FCM35_KLT21189 [Carex littledalei]